MSFDLLVSDGDLQLAANRDLATVTGTDKLIQDIIKIIVTPINGNPFFPWYGSPLGKSLIGRAMERRFVSSIATQQVRASLDRLQTLQKEQLRKNQIVIPAEQLAAIQKVIVERNPQDPRFYTIDLTVLTKAFSRQQIPISVRMT